MLSNEQKQQTEDFYMFQDQERGYFRKFESKALSAKAGSLFLWDSRLAHQNLLPGKSSLSLLSPLCVHVHVHTRQCMKGHPARSIIHSLTLPDSSTEQCQHHAISCFTRLFC